MQRFSASWFALAAIACLQAISAFVLLDWALPLFFDQPLLGNGVSSRANALARLVASSPGASPVLDGMAEHYRWLFWRQMEGVEATLGACAALLGSSAVTFAVLLSRPHKSSSLPIAGA